MTGAAQLVEPPQGGQHALADAAVLAEVLDDLQILPGSGLLDAEKHGGLLSGHHHVNHTIWIINSKTGQNKHNK